MEICIKETLNKEDLRQNTKQNETNKWMKSQFYTRIILWPRNVGRGIKFGGLERKECETTT